MKYAASYHDTELITATGQTTYSEWFDITWANQLHSFLKFEESETGTSESIAVTLERFQPLDMNPEAILNHGSITAAGTSNKHAYHPDEVLGFRVRWKYVSSGTFTADQIITLTMVLYAKRN